MGKKRRAGEQRKTLETRIDSSLLEGYQGRRILFEVNDIPILATLGRIGTQFIEVTRISILYAGVHSYVASPDAVRVRTMATAERALYNRRNISVIYEFKEKDT